MSDMAQYDGTTLTIDIVELAERMTKEESRLFVQSITHLNRHIVDAVIEQVVEGECKSTNGWLSIDAEAELRAKLESMMPDITARHVATTRALMRVANNVAINARAEARAWEKTAGILAGWLTTEAPSMSEMPQRIILGRAARATSGYHQIGRNSYCHIGRLIRDAYDWEAKVRDES